MTEKEPRCIHRHTIDSHPNCFRKGLIKREDWWHDLRIGYLDIEASNLKANWGIMLSWCIKPRGEKDIIESVITKDEIFNYNFDYRVTGELMDAMTDFDILVTYYGTGFDIPFMRTRALYHGFEFPEFGSIYHWDLYYKVRSKLKLHNNRLETATKFFDIEGKTHLEPEQMIRARYGDPESLKWLLHHNQEDVIILEKLHEKLWSHSKWIRKSI
jgi:uncharacterized protein YprB with RNaseH-like and TPR domain